MECHKIQQWLMTDYLDGEADTSKKLEIDGHLQGCLHCREFLEVVQKTSLSSFPKMEIQPDPVVWEKIQEGIEAEKERSRGWFWKLTDLCLALRKPMPVLRVAFAMGLLVAVVFLARWPASVSSMDPGVQAYLSDQSLFMSALGIGDTEWFNGDFANLEAAFQEIAV